MVILPLLIIVLIWGLFILPSSLNPNWFYLDDPTTLFVSKLLASNFHLPKPDGTTGRYFPAYWLYYVLLYHFFGLNLTGYYAVQALMFLLSLCLVYVIVLRFTQSIFSGLLAVFLVNTTAPVAENLYTFGKAEPKILFYLLCVIYLFMMTERIKENRKLINPALCIGITLLIVAAIFTKETSIVFFVFATVGAAIGWLLNKKRDEINNYDIKSYLFLLAASVGAILITRGLFYVLRPSTATNNYVSYAINLKLLIDNFTFYYSQQPDVLFLGLMTAVLAGVFYKVETKNNVRNFTFVSALFLTGVGYILGLLFWRWPLGYYLLVPASFFSIAIAIMLPSLFRSSLSNRIAYIAIALILLTRVYSIPYFSFIAHSQKYQDEIYTEAINQYMRTAKPDERLIVEDWPFFTEPIVQSNLLLKNIYRREYLNVEGVQDILQNMTISAETKKLHQISGIPDEKSREPKKNDYILTFTGNRQSKWMLRGISPYNNEKGSVYKVRGLGMKMIATHTIKWSGVAFTGPYWLPEIRTYSNGYCLYKVGSDGPNIN